MRDLVGDAISLPIPLTDLTSLGADDISASGVKPTGVAAAQPPQGGSLSQKQVEYFIATQVNLLVHNETKALSPRQLQVFTYSLRTGVYILNY